MSIFGQECLNKSLFKPEQIGSVQANLEDLDWAAGPLLA